MAFGYGNYPTYMPQQYQPIYTGVQQPMQSPQSALAVQGVNNTQSAFRCVPVTSYAQADAFQIPFDGSTTYFVDTSNGKIYSKAFDFNTGSAPLAIYVREQEPFAVQYATLDDLKALREELTAKPKKAVKKDDPDE